MSTRSLVIAIDGPAASGKTTTARLVAGKLGYLHIDTGAMYRAVTHKVLCQGLRVDEVRSIIELLGKTTVQLRRDQGSLKVFVDDQEVTDEIRSEQVTRAVSAVSSIREVRAVMVREQRKLGEHGGVVLEGRDIGTVVFPKADLKIFMMASLDARALRRQQELTAKGVRANQNSLKNEIEQRDQLDSTRNESPLRRASDAIVLDTSNLTIDEQVEFIVKRAKEMIRLSGVK